MRNRLQFQAVQPGPSYDVDAQSYFNRIVSNGGTISLSQKTAINTFVRGLKTDNLWTSIIDLNPLCGNQMAAVLTKLKYREADGSTYTNTNFVNGDIGALGLTGGNTKVLNSNVDIPTLSQASTFMGLYVTQAATASGSYQPLMASSYPATGGTDRWYNSIDPATATTNAIGCGAYNTTVNASNGFLLFGQSNATGTDKVFLYRNGTEVTSNTSLNTWQQTGTINFLGGQSGGFWNGTAGLAIVTTGLSAANVGLLNTRVQTLMTALGRI